MTRLQELQWAEEALEQDRFSQPAKRQTSSIKVDLFHIPWMRRLLKDRWLQFALRSISLLGFVFTILTALSGTRVGSHNFAIIVVWIAWWTALKLGFIPLGGRTWCSICPIPLAGDWLKQGSIIKKTGTRRGLNLRWPKSLRGAWLQSSGFLLIGLFSAVTLTDPHVTGWILLSLFAFATGMSVIFEHRAFCSHICPVGGFSGMYAKTAPIELRVIEKTICQDHQEKSCYQACPWGLYPLSLKDSSECGMCLDCLRACPKDNLALNIRSFGSDLTSETGSIQLDETFLALVMLGSALVFSAVFVGPWGWLKSAAYEVGSLRWVAYGMGFLTLTVLFLPGLFTGFVWLGKRINRINLPLKRLIADASPGLLTMGLLAWIAFTVSFALPKLNLVVGVLNDPFGWGWHWLNLANPSQSLDVSRFSPFLQVALVVIGVFWAARVSVNKSNSAKKEHVRSHLPLLVFHLAYSATLLWLLLG